MNITVYTKDTCVQCKSTKRTLAKLGLDYTEINIDKADKDEAEELHSYLKGLGYTAVPVVFIDENNHWAGFRPDNIKNLAKKRASIRV